MKRSRTTIWLLAIALFFGADIGSVHGQTFTQGDDPLVVAPEVLIIVDTSGSMTTTVTEPTTGRVICESNTDGSTCYDCTSSNMCSMCIASDGSCDSVSGYSNTGNTDPITGRTLCQSSSTCSKCINTSGSCASVSGYTDSGAQDTATGRDICNYGTFCKKVTIGANCTSVTGYTDSGTKDSATSKEICWNVCSKVITTKNALSGTCGTGGSTYTKSTKEPTTGRYWCTKSGNKYLDCSDNNLDCYPSCLDCTICLDCSNSCYDSSGKNINVNATALTRQTAVRQVLAGNYNSCGVGTCCANQRTDGVLDTYKEVIRFGFATYDDDRNCGNSPCRGVNTNNYPACESGDSKYCTDRTRGGGKLGIKGRNQGTGSLIDVVDTTNPTDLVDHAALVKSQGACLTTALTSTPINAALWDALWYYNHWQAETGYTDPGDSCRSKYVVLLTDGENNGPSIHDPATSILPNPTDILYGYDTEEAQHLFDATIPLYVIGFGNDVAGTGGSSDLNEMQKSGSGGKITTAFSAIDPAGLTVAFGKIMSSILAGQASRTSLVSAPSMTSDTLSYSYTAWMEITTTGLAWIGHLVRLPVLKVDDSTGLPVLDMDKTHWVYFEKVLASQNASDRNIYTVVNDPRSQTFSQTSSPIIRPVGTDPLIDLYPFKTGSDPTQLEPLMCLQNTESVTNAVLMGRIRDFVRGVPGSSDVNGKVVNIGPYLGDIFHSNPVIVQPPSALTPDFKYEVLFQQYKTRPSMIYVGANDGMLHAFIAEQNDPTKTDPVGKELWAFIPTNLLSNIQQTRLGHYTFVDGSPVVKDLLFNGLQATDPSGKLLKDSNNNPITGVYRTVLISGERGGGSAYFALDVTDPYHPSYLWEYRTDVPTSADYTNSQFQCRDSKLQSWSSPIVGQVWLKNKVSVGGQDYQSRSVMIVPGGYMPPQALLQATSCVEFMEGLSNASSIHVVDVETGKLLDKIMFSNSITTAMQNDINTFYNTISANNCYTSPNNTGCKSWPGINRSSSDYNATTGTGWTCTEKRTSIARQLPIPNALLASATCSRVDTSTTYEVKCCDSLPCSSSNACYYHYYKKKGVTGGITVELKTDSCALVIDPNDRGHFTLQIGDSFQTESVAATGVAQDTAFGEYITRVFVPTTLGKIYRIDLSLAQYDSTASEGNMISTFTSGGIPYQWDVGRSTTPPYDPVPWYDTIVDTSNIRRPIMVSPAIALDYDRNLVLFFGSGVTDNLETTATLDYVWAVKETSTYNSSHKRYEYNVNGTRAGQAFALSQSERLFGKPLVLGGTVYFSTFIPITSACDPGKGAIYGKNFADLSQDVISKIPLPVGDTPTGPTVVWTPTGPAVVIKQGGMGFQGLGGLAITSSAHLMHWGRVL